MNQLSWADHSSNLRRFLSSDTALHDVTLICDDGQQVGAHRAVLAAGSQFFRDLFSSNPANNSPPWLYLRGVSLAELESVITFLYHGELQLPEEEIEKFVTLAKDLKLNVVQESIKLESVRERIEIPHGNTEQSIIYQYLKQETTEIAEDMAVQFEKVNSKTEDKKLPDQLGDEAIKRRVREIIKKVDGLFECNICQRNFTNSATAHRHAATHLENISVSCNECHAELKNNHTLYQHKLRYHSNDLVQCKLCCQKMTRLQLRNHQARKIKCNSSSLE